MVKRYLSLSVALIGTFFCIYLSTNGSASYSSFGGWAGNFINDTFFASRLSAVEVSALMRFGWKAFGHVLLYLVTGLCYGLFFSTLENLRYKKAILLGIGIAVSFAGEVTQLFTPTRTASMIDVAINFTSFMSLPLILGLLKKTR